MSLELQSIYISNNGGGGGGEQWTRVTLNADYITSGGSEETVTGMNTTLDDYGLYRIRGIIYVENLSGVNANSIYTRIGDPNESVFCTFMGAGILDTSPVSIEPYADVQVDLTTHLPLPSNAIGRVCFEGIISVGSINGEVYLTLQNTPANAHCTLKTGSFYEYLKLE
jgi:hypothetical protein